MLQFGSATDTVAWFNEYYSMNEMGGRAVRGHGRKLFFGKSYKIIYRDRTTVKTERTSDIKERNGKYIFAHATSGMQ